MRNRSDLRMRHGGYYAGYTAEELASQWAQAEGGGVYQGMRRSGYA